MKIRTISMLLIFALAVLLPLAAQQSPAPPVPTAPADATKSSCACCSHAAPEAADHDQTAMSCCSKKSSGEMSCCTSKPDKATSESGKMKMECDKENVATMCDGKEGKSCCSDSKCTKPCCGKTAAAS